MTSLEQNYRLVQKNIDDAARRVQRDPRDITLIAVSKSTDDATLAAAIELGISDFGENRASHLLRRSELFPGVRWHMIGQLQSNKVKPLIGSACLIHSLDRWSLAEAIELHSARSGVVTPALIEVNVAAERQKGGLALDDLSSFIDALGALPHLRVCGLMCMAPLSDRAEDSRPVFRLLHEQFRYYKALASPHFQMEWLSMGMSQDYTVAVEEGANLLRVGSAVFAES